MAIISLLFVSICYSALTNYQLLMWLSFVSLLFHQLEEYRFIGTFPGMVNTVMFRSDTPDRYPLNTNTALIVNVCLGWSTYLLAAIAGEKTVFLGIATIMVSIGNIIAHTIIFNLKGSTIYNAGLITSWFCLAPCVFFFFKVIHTENLAVEMDYLIGAPLGIILNVFGILKPITWLADKNTTYIFENRNLLPKDRK